MDFYQISSLDSGLYDLIVSAFGYENDTISVLLDNGVVSNLNISLDPYMYLS